MSKVFLDQRNLSYIGTIFYVSLLDVFLRRSGGQGFTDVFSFDGNEGHCLLIFRLYATALIVVVIGSCVYTLLCQGPWYLFTLLKVVCYSLSLKA